MCVWVCVCVCVQEFVDTVADGVFAAGFYSNQATDLTKYMVILILVYYPHHMDFFVNFCVNYTNVTFVIASLATFFIS